MNPAQTSLYLRTWSAAVEGYYAGQVWQSPELNQQLGKIYEAATVAAALEDRAITADDLRHGCTLIATGRHVSSKFFANSEFDQVLALLRVLANPTNLKALGALQNGAEAGERRRHVYVITRADAPYWKSIAKDRFGHTDLDRLPISQLRQLALTIRNRRQSPAHCSPIAA